MGGSKKVTTGYRYFLGLHMAVCYGPIDRLKRILVGDRLAWGLTACGVQQDASASGTIFIDSRNLFGSDAREGGVMGHTDVLMGEATQGPNAYLQSQLGSQIPSYRGVFSLVFKGPSAGVHYVAHGVAPYVEYKVWSEGYVGSNNPYLKPWALQVERITKGWQCDAVWYPEKAAIGVKTAPKLAFYFALDSSDSMNELSGNGHTRLFNMKTAMTAVLDKLDELIAAGTVVDVCLVSWNYTNPPSSITRRAATASDIVAIKAFLTAITTAFGTDFRDAVEGVADFFNGADPEMVRLFYLLTDGDPYVTGSPGEKPVIAQAAADTLFAVNCVQAYAFNIDYAVTTYSEYLDNTPADGVPVVASGDPAAITSTIVASFYSMFAMNPAHIVYQCVTDANWGMGYPAAAIDDANFTAVADALYEETFGLCMIWNQQTSIQEFIGLVMNHIGGIFYADPTTGKFKLKLLRDDYDAGALEVFDESSIIELESFQRVGYGETTNEITVVYRDQDLNRDSAVTVQDLANINAQGAVVSKTVQYPGLPSAVLAGRVAERDLIASSTPLAKARIRVNRNAWSKIPGDVIKLSWSKLGLSGVVMRVLGINTGTLTDGAITVDLAEDVFGLPDSTYAAQEPGAWTEPDVLPSPITIQALVEAPYWTIARTFEPTDFADVDADAGYVRTLAARSSSTWQGYRIWSRVGATTFEERNVGAFSASATLLSSIDQQATTITIQNGIDLGLIEAGKLLVLGSGQAAEWVEAIAVDLGAGTIDVARGVLDTTPANWAMGTRVWLADEYLGDDPTERATSEVVDVRLATIATGGELDVADATNQQITLAQRFARPYPPGNISINGSAWPTTVSAALSVTWSHRDRTQQTAYVVHQDEASIGPEDGTAYNAYIYDDGTDELLVQELGIGDTSWAPVLNHTGPVRLEIESTREGIVSWQRQVRRFTFNYVNADARLLEDGSYRLLESGGLRLLESDASDPAVGSGYRTTATIVFSGTMNADDEFYITAYQPPPTPGGQYTDFPYTVVAAGKSTLDDLAEDLRAQLAADFTAPDYLVERFGATVILHALTDTAPLMIQNNTIEYRYSEYARPLEPVADVPQEVTIDLWKLLPTGEYSPAPDTDANYYGPWSMQINFPMSDGSTRIVIASQDSGANQTARLPRLGALMDKVLQDSYFTDHGFSAVLTGVWDVRPQLLIRGDGDRWFRDMPYTLQTHTDSSGFNPKIELRRERVVGVATAQPASATVAFALPGDMAWIGNAPQGVQTGQIFIVTLNSVEFSYTITAGDVGGGDDHIDIYNGLKAVIEASGDYTVAQSGTDPLAIVITQVSTGIEIDFDHYASYGLRCESTHEYRY